MILEKTTGHKKVQKPRKTFVDTECVQLCLFSVFRLERQRDRRFRDIEWEIKI